MLLLFDHVRLCNACGLAYAKRLRQDEEAAASANRAEQQQLSFDYNQSPAPSYYSLSYLGNSPSSSQLVDPYQLAPLPSQSPMVSPSYQQSQIPTYIPYEQLAEYAAMNGYNLYSPRNIAMTPPASPLTPPMSSLSPSSIQIPRSPFRNTSRPNGHTFHQYTPPVTSRTSSYINFSPNYSPTVTTTTTTTLGLGSSPHASTSSYGTDTTVPSTTNTPLITGSESPAVFSSTSPTPMMSANQTRAPTPQPLQLIQAPSTISSLQPLQPLQPATHITKPDQQLAQTMSSTRASSSPSLTPLSTIATFRPGTPPPPFVSRDRT